MRMFMGHFIVIVIIDNCLRSHVELTWWGHRGHDHIW
jgi:hypothetical protein